MPKASKIRILLVCCCGFMMVSILLWQHQALQRWGVPRLIQCDVGQGDAIVLILGFTQVLIDAGPDEQVLECLHTYLPWLDTKLEVVIATHLDADHIGGIPGLVDRYTVETLITTSQQKDTDQAREYWQALSELAEQQTTILYARAGQRLEIGNLGDAVILWPPGENGGDFTNNIHDTEAGLSALEESKNEVKDDYNAGSIVLLLNILNTNILLTGDAEEKTELALRDRGVLEPIDIIKVGHHGSKSSSTADFLANLQPEVALIGVGSNNRYHHPDESVLARLEDVGAKVWRTDLHGSVEVILSSNHFQVRPTRRDQSG